MPDLQGDRELAAFVASRGFTPTAATVRNWRDSGYFAPREAPGVGGGGRLRSSVSDEDRAIAVALAEALGSLPRLVRLSEAAVAAWGLGAPVYHGRPEHPTEGLRGALAAEYARLVDIGSRTLELAERGSRKARAAILSAAPGEAGRDALRAMLGQGGDAVGAALALGARSETLEAGGLVWRNPNDPKAPPQALSRLSKFFEGPAILATEAETAKYASRSTLDARRDLARELFSGPMASLWEYAVANEDEGAVPGWHVGMYAVALVSYPPGYADLLEQLMQTRSGRRALAGGLPLVWTPPSKHALGRGRPRKGGRR